jgi:hypothetical protein
MRPSFECCIFEMTQRIKFDTEGYLQENFNLILYSSNVTPALQAQIKMYRVLKIPSYNKVTHDVEW